MSQIEPTIVYVDMDDVLCDYSTAHKSATMHDPEVLFPQSKQDFFLNLVPLPDAISTFEYLLDSATFDPYILTAPSIENPLCYTEKRLWVEKYLGLAVTNKLIICANKGLLKGDMLIDDWTFGRGQENFEGILLEFGSSKFQDWQAVKCYLQAL